MPWCPKCKIEYVSGIKMCSDCHIELTEDFPTENGSEKYAQLKLVPVVTVSDESEAGRIEALLTTNNIPVMRKYEGPGEAVKIITGNTSFGIEIHVPEPFARAALNVLRYEDAGTDAGDYDENEEIGEDDFNDIEDIVDADGEVETEESTTEADGSGGIIKVLVTALVVVVAIIVVMYTRGAW